jgi:hypothetical protein
MRKLLFSLALLTAVPSAFASDLTKGSWFGNPGAVMGTESLAGCKSGCYLLLTNQGNSLSIEVHNVKTDQLIGTLHMHTADVVLKMRAHDYHILKANKGTKLYTNADLGKN